MIKNKKNIYKKLKKWVFVNHQIQINQTQKIKET